MKKYLALFLMIALCLSANHVSANDFSVMVDSKSANPGDTVDINISLKNNSGIIAALFELDYDENRLELINVKDGQLLEGGTFSPNYKSYPYKMLWNSASYANFTDDGILATLTFKVLDSATTGDAFINLSYDQNNIYDVDLHDVSLSIQNGNIHVTGNTQSTLQTGKGNGVRSLLPNQIILKIGQKKAVVFGKTKTNDVAPIIRNDRTMLPARFVAENLGATVEWVGEEQKVVITKEDILIFIYINSDKAYVHDEEIMLDSPAFIENDRTYTPLRFIAEKLGSDVDWNAETQEVTITKQIHKREGTNK